MPSRQLTDGFKKYLMTQENAPLLEKMLAGEDLRGQLRHDSYEPGTDTVGFGRKLTQLEHDSGYIDGREIDSMGTEAAIKLFSTSIRDTEAKMEAKLQKLGRTSDALSARQYEALLDFEYNVTDGLNEFPKYTQAVLAHQWGLAEFESTRHATEDKTGVKKPLEERNRAWKARFMNQYSGEQYGSPLADAEEERVMTPGKVNRAKVEAELQAQQGQQQPQETLQQQGAEDAQVAQQFEQQSQAPQALADTLPVGAAKRPLLAEKVYGGEGMLSPNFKYYGK